MSYPQYSHSSHWDRRQPPPPRQFAAWSPYKAPIAGVNRYNSYDDDQTLVRQGSSSSSSSYLHKEAQLPRATLDPTDELGKRDGFNRRRVFFLGSLLVLVGLVFIAGAVVVPIYFEVIRPQHGTTRLSTSSKAVISGGTGSMITTESGSTFQYINDFGGFWVDDPNDSYNDNAQAQSWSPPLNQSWRWGVDVVRGVNLGGWLVPEPFIVPALFQKYQNTTIQAIDEWTLSENMANDTANGGLGQLEDHYNTFITEEDFARIAGAGLNWVRLPIPFWAIQKYSGEPFLEGVAWEYALKAFKWARKYGLRVNLDLHTMPGSQNGFNHSGKQGQINFLYGVMGLANGQRGLDYMRILVEFISQKEYANLIPYFGVMNEAEVTQIGMGVMGSFYLHMHDILRNITGYGEGNGPYLSIHDGFVALSSWTDFLPGRDRVALDTHKYMVFTNANPAPLAQQLQNPCKSWSASVNESWSTFGVTTAGEFSLAINDCGLWLNGVGAGARWDGTKAGYTGPTGGDPNGCTDWNDWASWNDTRKSDLKQYALASMDALQNWFFWTWKIGNSSSSGTVEAPMWSYSLGLEQGWLPTDPRLSVGVCGGKSPALALRPNMTGSVPGAGPGDISDAVRAANPWPPATFGPGNWSATALPAYTATGPIPTLAPTISPTSTGSTVTASSTSSDRDAPDGWYDVNDTIPIHTPIITCNYPNAWEAEKAVNPGPCGAPFARRAPDRVLEMRTPRYAHAPAVPKRTAYPI
ncbi:hypothetical protein FRB96_002776 [Tulasnella sp. 330]|nr:hypothetical protein FRB96_002776 [Tulasnella sp. 330]